MIFMEAFYLLTMDDVLYSIKKKKKRFCIKYTKLIKHLNYIYRLFYEIFRKNKNKINEIKLSFNIKY